MHPVISGRISVSLFTLFSSINCVVGGEETAATTAVAKPQPAYFGQTLPGETPALFAPEKLNALSPWVEATTFSPDGTQFFVSVGAADYSSGKLYHSKLAEDGWTPIVEAPFLSDFTYSNEPVFSADGATLTFTGKKGTETTDLWTVSYSNQGWGTPVMLSSPINSGAREWRGSYMQDGTFYFGSDRSDQKNGLNQVYKATKDSGLMVELVGAPISTKSYECDPCIAPDGRFLIFGSGRDWKSSDLYVSFRGAQEGWGTPIKLGPQFNTSAEEYGAHLSCDGKYLFFTRHTREGTSKGNQIYWVAVSAIDKLKP